MFKSELRCICYLQVLLRRLRFKLERGHRSSDFINRSGRCLKMEPLTTVGEIETYLMKMVILKIIDIILNAVSPSFYFTIVTIFYYFFLNVCLKNT